MTADPVVRPVAAGAIAGLPIVDVPAALATTAEGLTSAAAASRRALTGPNTLPHVPGRSLASRLVADLTHVMALLLWVAGAVGFIAGLPELGIAIWLVNLINGAFSFWQEYRAEKATAALARLLPRQVRLVRDGVEQRLAAEEIVPGDVVLLAEGDHVPADARLVEEAELRVDQSTLTGESDPVRKTADPVLDTSGAESDLRDLVFAGTSVSAGTGRAVVFATGANTAFGRIAYLTQTVSEVLSPLQVELAQATRVVTVLAVAIGAVVFGLSVAVVHIGPAESFIFAMGMVVAFVPEGMLPLVTLSLAMATQRMAGRNALVKRLSAVETLGCTTVVCTDKTGTLTQNEMTVRRIWLPGRSFVVSGVGYAPVGGIRPERGEAPPTGEATQATGASEDPVARGDLVGLLSAGALCCDARLVPPDAAGGVDRWTALGDPTEAALIVAALKAGVDPAAEARARPRLREFPFDSHRKRMATLHRGGGPDGTPSVVGLVKGAPGEMLARCTRVREHGVDRPLETADRTRAMAANDGYARSGLRVLAIAGRTLDVDAPTEDLDVDDVETDLTLYGLVAMHDPPRPEVEAAVETCHRAGLRVILITGDYGLTAESIARRIGIIHGDVRLVTGVELDTMSDETLGRVLADDVVFARVSPEHKLRIVAGLQALGHVVAVTGDGVNDAPALKKADIGVAMGLAGTDVAKESADMILLDDNFASIVSAIEEGRGVYAAIKRFVGYIFTSNAPEAWPFVLYAFSGGQIPLALPVMQVLAIDLGTDMAPALALGAEPPEPGVMDRPPRSRRDHVITRGLLVRSLLFLGTIQSLVALSAFFLLYWTSGYPGQWLDLPASGPVYAAATAMTLASIVMTQVGNLFAHRTDRVSVLQLGRRRLLGNRLVWAGIAVELVLIVLLVYTPIANTVFGTGPFAPAYWLYLVLWLPVLLVADELRKAVVRRRERSHAAASATSAPTIRSARAGGGER